MEPNMTYGELKDKFETLVSDFPDLQLDKLPEAEPIVNTLRDLPPDQMGRPITQDISDAVDAFDKVAQPLLPPPRTRAIRCFA
jgi:hypothetical protein